MPRAIEESQNGQFEPKTLSSLFLSFDEIIFQA